MMRFGLGLVAGVVTAVCCVFLIEMAGHAVFPLPAGLDITDPADQARAVAQMPAAALVFVLLGWFVGALAGAWVANRIAGNILAGWVVALVVAASGIATMVMIPHPAWMWVAGIALPMAAGWIAQKAASRHAAS